MSSVGRNKNWNPILISQQVEIHTTNGIQKVLIGNSQTPLGEHNGQTTLKERNKKEGDKHVIKIYTNM